MNEQFQPVDSEAMARWAAIERLWLDDAAALIVAPPGSQTRETAKKLYVIDLWAHAEWGEAHGVSQGQAGMAQRLNQLYHEGLYRAAEARGAEVTPHLHLTYRGWRALLSKIEASIRTVDNEHQPATLFELAQWLHGGKAWFVDPS